MYSNHLQYLPLPWTVYLLLLGALGILTALIQIGLMRYVYARLGITPATAMLLLLGSLFGSYINIPIASFPEETVVVRERVDFFGMEYIVPTEVDWPGTIIAINLGGAVIPILLSLYLLAKNRIWIPGLIATAVVAAACYAVANRCLARALSFPSSFRPLSPARCRASLLSAERLPSPM